MAAGLTATGTLTYNGYTFDGASRYRVVTRKVRDEANRKVLYLEFDITVETIIASGSFSESEMERLQGQLSQDGGELVLFNTGFGPSISINKPGATVRDVKSGPKTEIVSWVPIGSNRAAEVTWNVKACVPFSSEGVPQYKGIMALNYEVSFSIDRHLDTTRTITGYLEIAQSLASVNAGFPSDSADLYRQSVSPNPPLGFLRTQNEWRVSKDKSRLDFTLVDVQVPSRNAYPEKVTEISGTHEVNWNRRSGRMLRNTISMTITPAAKYSGTIAWLIFVEFVQKRISAATRFARAALIDEIKVKEDIWGRPCSFQVGYRLLASDLGDLLQESGIWLPIGTDWKRWRTSMEGLGLKNRGTAELDVTAQNDVIVSLFSNSKELPAFKDAELVAIDRRPTSGSRATLVNKKPDPDKSYLVYNATVIPSTKDHTVVHHTLQEPVKSANAPPATSGGATVSMPEANATSDTVQQRSMPSYRVWFVGNAVRAGYPVPRPSLDVIGNQKCVELQGTFSCSVVDNWLGVTIYKSQWAIEYAVSNSPATVSPPANPEVAVDESGKAKPPT